MAAGGWRTTTPGTRGLRGTTGNAGVGNAQMLWERDKSIFGFVDMIYMIWYIWYDMHDTICHMPQNHVVFFKDVFEHFRAWNIVPLIKGSAVRTWSVESMWSTERCCVGVNKAGADVHGNMRVETFCCKVRRTPAGHFGSEGCGSTQQRSMGLWAVAPAPVLWRVLLLWTWEGCFTLRATKLALFAQLHVRGTSRQ